jgi:mannitol-specific phosphotransferase system IIBC component
MSMLLKIIAGLMAAASALAIVLIILGMRPADGAGSVIGSAFEALISALVFAAIAKLLDDTAASRRQLDHIQTQVDEIRWERRRTPGQP